MSNEIELPPRVYGFSKLRQYPWEEWLDGRVHTLRSGEHFHGPPRRFAQAAYAFARDHGFDVATRRRGDVVSLLFVRRAHAAG